MQAKHITSAAKPGQFPEVGLPEFAFLGRSNVGKSSLLNRLVQQKGLAFTSSTPGRTQVINFYEVESAICLADLPGYGYAKVPRGIVDTWRELIEQYLLTRQELAAAIVLLDARRGWMEKDRELQEWLQFHGRPYIVVATKIDKLTQKELHSGLAAIREQAPGVELVPFSAVTGRGARELWQAIWKSKNKP